MNKVILLGRLTKDPEIRYSNGAVPVAIANYTLAVNKRVKRTGEPDADFIQCVSFGKSAEFAEKYFRKGQQVCVSGRLQVRKWKDKEDVMRWLTEVVVEEQNFADSKKTADSATSDSDSASGESSNGFIEADAPDSDDQPF